MHDQQHDHHCWITFMGENWLIWRTQLHGMLLDVWRPCVLGGDDGRIYATITLVKADVAAYCRAAVINDFVKAGWVHKR